MMSNEETRSATKDIKADFEALPLGEKYSQLLKMEAVTLSETVDYFMASPKEAMDKVGDTLAELGRKLGQDIKEAFKQPEASKQDNATEASTDGQDDQETPE
ncbi:MAG: hypothetical protein M9893_10245 [Pyrinomonadaceae bacterium]|nr:hypothetical protein [Pyrinomonadaceae bacterium]